jgi:sulfur-oxidizing protein SoxZ
MSSSIKVRAKVSDGTVTVKTLMKHPMETGQRKDSKTGELIPAHYIKEVVCEYQGETVMTANWGPAVSKNPYMSFKFSGGTKGDTLKISWVDNQEKSDSVEAEIK